MVIIIIFSTIQEFGGFIFITSFYPHHNFCHIILTLQEKKKSYLQLVNCSSDSNTNLQLVSFMVFAFCCLAVFQVVLYRTAGNTVP